jgi:sugar phosphate isomerase/epimerase
MFSSAQKLTRREALAAAVATAGFAMLGVRPASANPASGATSVMKLGCGTVNFRTRPLKDAWKRIRRAGFGYCEIQAIDGWCPHANIWKDDPKQFRQLAKDFGFQGVTGLWSPNGAIIPDAKSVEGISQAIRWAKEAGIPTVFAGDGHKPDAMSDADALKLLTDRLAAILEVADQCGVNLAIEPHGDYSLTADGLKKIMSLSKSKRLGINFDTANVHRATYVETVAGSYGWTPFGKRQDEVATLKAVVDRVLHVHVKDIVGTKCVAIGDGDVNVLGCINVLKQHGYAGVLSLETEGEVDAEQTQRLIERSRAYLLRALEA